MASKMEAIMSNNITITADDLATVNSQTSAKEVLKRLLDGVSRGCALLAADATAAIEQFCPALARVIREAIFRWNHYQHSLISEP